MRKAYILLILTVVLTGSVGMIAYRENMLAHGVDALLPLSPRDPRALMTGDYMDLDYQVNHAVAEALRSLREDIASRQHPRRAVMRLGTEKTPEGDTVPNILTFVRLDDDTPLGAEEVFLAFSVRDGRVLSASPAFHFQEGQGKAYEQARYGRLRISRSGASLLTALCDAAGKEIRPE
ncbi:MAG: GDYXXLXY domain-containing protein [Desulfovibrio sp.]|nr:GDYXXLXY domain-containing protein [Desulfovibrio sp.]